MGCHLLRIGPFEGGMDANDGAMPPTSRDGDALKDSILAGLIDDLL